MADVTTRLAGMTSTTPRPFTKRGLSALAVAAVLTLASCGGGGDSASSDDDSGSVATTVAAESGSPTTTDGPTEAAEAVAHLPIDGEAQDGFRLGAASCAAETGDDDYASWVVYGVPEGWVANGFSGGGSGGPHDSQELSFDIDGGNSDDGRVTVDVEWDSRSPDGTVLDVNGDPFESFDYEITIHGDETETHPISYEKVATVEVGEGEADLYYRDPTQNTEQLDTTAQYKARVTAYELPKNAPALDELTPYSFVVTVEFDTDDAALEQDMIESILGSFTFPQCTWDKILADAELRLGVDLDGDGHARNAEDAQAELQESLDELKDQLPPEARERMEEMERQLEGDTND